MDIEKIRKVVEGVPHMDFSQANAISKLIIENKAQNILELGFRHGVSTCYMAGALDELGGGKITTIDLENAKDAKPNIEGLLKRLELDNFVEVFYEPTSYTWRLMKMIESEPAPEFDFCYIDGAHDWFIDGFAFLLVDKLLKPGGLVVFDDLDWTYDTSPTLRKTDRVKNMPEEERQTPQIRKVYELLVKKDPRYGEFIEVDNWAIARKIVSDMNISQTEIRTEVIYQKERVGLGAVLHKLFKKISSGS